jgi:hypothetical protein
VAQEQGIHVPRLSLAACQMPQHFAQMESANFVGGNLAIVLLAEQSALKLAHCDTTLGPQTVVVQPGFAEHF